MSDAKLPSLVYQADLCRLLSACYYEPGAEFIEEKLFDSLLIAANQLDSALGAQALRLKESFENDSIDELLVDYSKLFLGPGHTLAPPYESAWRGKNSDDPMDSVQTLIELYDDGGFAIDPDFRDLPDHIAVELEFLYTLIFQQAAAMRSGDIKSQEHAKALQSILQTRHINIWLDNFIDAVRENAEWPFYKNLAGLTMGFLRSIGETKEADDRGQGFH